MVLGFFNRLKYRTSCTDKIILFTGINRDSASKFVEWYKNDINYYYKKGFAPEVTLVSVCIGLLKDFSGIDKPEHVVVLYAFSQEFIKIYPESYETGELKRLLSLVEDSPLFDEIRQFERESSSNNPGALGMAVQATVEQSLLFMSVSLRLVDDALLNRGIAKLGSCVFFAGAIGFLAGINKLDEEEYNEVVFQSVRNFGISAKSATAFVASLPELVTTNLRAQSIFTAGRETVSDWVTDKDEHAPLRLFDFVAEWGKISLDDF